MWPDLNQETMGLLSFRNVWRGVAALLLLVVLLVGIFWLIRPRIDETAVRQMALSAIQSESAESFFVTGSLELSATSVVENTRYLLPDLLRIDLGTTRATVRLPGRVAYGFDVRLLQPEDITFTADRFVEVRLPDLAVFSAEPRLADMEVQTEVGWARTYARSGQEVTQEAIRQAQDILRLQAKAHLETNTQPRVNTALALEKLLTPVLQSAGLTDPRFRFHIGSELIMQPSG